MSDRSIAPVTSSPLPWEAQGRLSSGIASPSAIFGADLVGWWHRGNVTTSGSNITAWPDNSGNNNNGTGTNNPQLTSNVLVFSSASSQRVEVPDSASLDLTTAATIAMRVRPDSLAGAMAWLAKGPATGGSFSVQYSGELRLWTGTPGVNGQAWSAASASLTVGQWVTLVWVYGSSAVSLYTNGSLATPGTSYGSIPASLPVGTDPLWIAGYTNAVQFFSGAFGSVVMAKVAASAAQRDALRAYLDSTGP